MTSPTNLFTSLEESSRTRHDKIAIVEGNVATTYQELRRSIDGYAAKLDQGTQAGDVVGVQCQSKTQTLAALYACFRTGRTAVCLQKPNREEAEYTVADAGISAILNENESLEVPEAAAHKGHHDPAVIIYTSGTTASFRKGVLISHHCIGNAASFMNGAMEVTDEINEILVAPIDHLYGLGRCHSVLSAGGTPTLTGSFVTVLDTLARDGNSLGIVPSVIATLLRDHERRFQEAGRNLRWMQTGAMRLEQDYRQKLLEVFPEAKICMHYGLTEIMRATFLHLREEQTKMHTEGRPRPGVNIEIQDDAGVALPPGNEGEIWISGGALAMGYTRDEVWQERIRNGWYRTGDIGQFDDDGYLIFQGRSDDIVNVNGYLVHPAEVESHLSELTGTPICVVAAPDPRGARDTVLVLCVEGATEIGKREVIAHMSGAEKHMIPEYVKSVPKFPRTGTGKIRRKELSKILGEI